MSTQNLVGTTAVVTGASRGFGRGIAAALSAAGANVVGVARDRAQLETLQEQLGDTFTPWVGDVADPVVAGRLIDKFQPRTLVLNAGASPLGRPISSHSWQSFSRNWDVDVQHVFHWTRESLLLPLQPGSVVLAFSSRAALGGSPLSGGYPGAKATIGFLSAQAAWESARRELGIIYKSVLPTLTPSTELGANGIRAYAALEGIDPAAYAARMGDTLTPEQVGKMILELALNPGEHAAYHVTVAGIQPLE